MDDRGKENGAIGKFASYVYFQAAILKPHSHSRVQEQIATEATSVKLSHSLPHLVLFTPLPYHQVEYQTGILQSSRKN